MNHGGSRKKIVLLATKLGTANKFFVTAATKNFAAPT